MAQSRKHFEQFEPHSKHKHLILENYFEAWGRKLLLRPGAGATVLFVDACAGTGMDEAGNPGSPIIAAQAGAVAEAQLGEMRGARFRVQVVAIEKKKSYFSKLAENLRPFGDHARAIQGTLADHLGAIQKEFGDAPTLFFIDPFGLEPLRADVVRDALSGPRNEALLLFADQAALRHFGAAVADETQVERDLRTLEEAPLLFPELLEQERARLAPQASKSRASLEITRDRAIEILTTAFGNLDWRTAVEAAPSHSRRQAFLDLYRAFLADCGARYILPIPVLNEAGDHVYYLVHASRSKHGYTTMKAAVEYALKHGPLPSDVTDRMRIHLRTDLASVERKVREHFAGQTVRWAEHENPGTGASVRAFVLEETPTFPFETKALQQRLKDARLPGKTILYRF